MNPNSPNSPSQLSMDHSFPLHDPSSSLWDWSDLLDFPFDDTPLPIPLSEPDPFQSIPIHHLDTSQNREPVNSGPDPVQSSSIHDPGIVQNRKLVNSGHDPVQFSPIHEPGIVQNRKPINYGHDPVQSSTIHEPGHSGLDKVRLSPIRDPGMVQNHEPGHSGLDPVQLSPSSELGRVRKRDQGKSGHDPGLFVSIGEPGGEHETVSGPDLVQFRPVTELGRVRKRDPRLTCENFLAGRVPCACPEMDALLLEEEEEEKRLPEKKRNRVGRGKKAGVAAVVVRCQVPECGADIRELKGYHRRHRVCLGCANAKVVVLFGVGNRYCQQCGKFHILSDFDEGKRSCRRKLERHNNRRRRKSTDPSVSVEKESEGIVLSDDLACEDENGKDCSYLSSQIAERVPLLESEEGKIPIPCSSSSPQNVQSDSVLTFTTSDETQLDFEKDESKSSPTNVYKDEKSGYPSVVPTGRISFKLYDWNPAEFPRRLRHQIFQWLASMPVELEGYIRPGCTILTAFVAMPSFMWLKLLQEPVVYVGDLVAGPEKMLSGRGTFLVHLDNMIFRVSRDGSSVMRIKAEERTPRLHYVHPTCFEAGKPVEFVACGSNLLQPNFRFLVSFGGKYLSCDYSVLPQHTDTEEVTSSDNQLLKIYIPHTEPYLFGPAFIEVENQSGLSNFLPILMGNREICSELKILEQRFGEPLCSQGSNLMVTGSSSDSCEVFSGQTSFSQFILDTAWLMRSPALEDIKHAPASFQIQRFNHLLDILIKNESIIVLVQVLGCIQRQTVVDLNSLTDELVSTDVELLEKNVTRAKQIVSGILKEDDVSLLQSGINLVHKSNCFCETADTPSRTSSSHQDSEAIEERKTGSNFEDRCENVSLIKKEVFTKMSLMKEIPRRYPSRVFTKKYLISRPLALAVASAAALCFCVCAVFIHPREVGRIATTIRISLFDSK